MSEIFQLPDDKKIIMMPARPSGWKGHEILIRAISKINNESVIKRKKDLAQILKGSELRKVINKRKITKHSRQ